MSVFGTHPPPVCQKHVTVTLGVAPTSPPHTHPSRYDTVNAHAHTQLQVHTHVTRRGTNSDIHAMTTRMRISRTYTNTLHLLVSKGLKAYHAGKIVFTVFTQTL